MERLLKNGDPALGRATSYLTPPKEKAPAAVNGQGCKGEKQTVAILRHSPAPCKAFGARLGCAIWLAQYRVAELCEHHAAHRQHLRAAACHVALAVLRLIESVGRGAA